MAPEQCDLREPAKALPLPRNSRPGQWDCRSQSNTPMQIRSETNRQQHDKDVRKILRPVEAATESLAGEHLHKPVRRRMVCKRPLCEHLFRFRHVMQFAE